MHRNLLLGGLVACTGGAGHSDATAPPTLPTAPIVTVTEALQARSFLVQPGAFGFATMAGCCDPDANCRGNNPSTPYGLHAVPPVPGFELETHGIVASMLEPPPGLMTEFRMREDEALVLFGTLPPAASYFGFRSYLGTRGEQDVVASLGASLNHQVIASQMGTEAIWGEPFAVITSADAAIEREAKAALVEAGFPEETIHLDRITWEVTEMGLEEGRDSFFTALRIAEYADSSAGEAWQAKPDLSVLRLTPTEAGSATEPHPWPTLPVRGNATDESHLRASLDALETAILQANPGLTAIPATAVPLWRETLTCIEDPLPCTGDLRDRLLSLSPQFVLGEDDYLVVFGPNHARAGKASYSSFSVQTIANQRGIEAVTSGRMPGSAGTWLPEDPWVEDLYAWGIARDCSGRPEPCLEVPQTCPGAPLDEELKVVFRAYLEPSTGAAPLPEELELDRMLLFRP